MMAAQGSLRYPFRAGCPCRGLLDLNLLATAQCVDTPSRLGLTTASEEEPGLR